MAKKKDEIDGAVKDGTEIQGTPEGELEITPEQEPEDAVVSLSSKEHQALTRQAKSAADLGRTIKMLTESQNAMKSSLDEQLKRYSDLETNFNTFRERDREAELDKYKDDKGMLDVIRLRHKTEDEKEQVNRERSEFEKERTLHQGRIEAALKSEAELLASTLAADSGLEASLILQIGTDTTQDGRTTYNLERMKQIAKSVPKGEEEEEGEENEPQLRGQRSRAAGAGSRTATRGLSTMEDFDKAYNEGRIGVEEYQKARIRFGVAY